MPMVGSETDSGEGISNRSPQQLPPGRWLRRLGWSALVLCVGLLLVLGIGFFWFVSRLPADEIALDRGADGIVVLTGGASRITDAIELLAAGRGRRLLISGANRSTRPTEISRLNPEFDRVVRCCVDFDRSLNTLGNAIETRRWVESRGFHSLIVVTSSYHMPRALAELAHQLPGVALVPYPVVSDRLRGESWWTSGTTIRLIFSEYLKYVVAQLRMKVAPGSVAAVSGAVDQVQARGIPSR
jgi:uncharacterized SAM-binding protein YcdF (DUF218 family)